MVIAIHVHIMCMYSVIHCHKYISLIATHLRLPDLLSYFLLPTQYADHTFFFKTTTRNNAVCFYNKAVIGSFERVVAAPSAV